MVLERSTALGVRSQIPALALLPLLLFWLQLSHLSNGHGTRRSLSCCPEPIMGFCMTSKEESGYKCIHSTLMGLFLWWVSLPLPCFSSVVYRGPPPQSQRKRGRKNTKQAISQLCTPRLAEKTCPWDVEECCRLSWGHRSSGKQMSQWRWKCKKCTGDSTCGGEGAQVTRPGTGLAAVKGEVGERKAG